MTESTRPDLAVTRRVERTETELVTWRDTGENGASDDAPEDGAVL